ncbi:MULTISPECIES: flagellin [unclassified Rhizobium]|mgnify:CR=1 FL=1|uniref:flagellin N-terminal helical domain-containing protein n=1 Tax=unclassified Rhizobium TaxID=2613769 RepID=UPI00069098D0|nr:MULTISPECIES: flagellin [unclassified Rhizobium]MBN8952285.1 flagellin C [Rhizobium tropici]OJY79769.1 MAG: flagellin C [Rhizobium sp. 60-20]RKD66888.1 flagellin [Rhizobium sp. WW_1]
MSIFSTFIRVSPSVNTALEVLRDTQTKLTNAERQMSSGLRIQTAKDNATYWKISTLTRTDIGAISSVQDALGLAASTVSTASTGVSSAIDVVTEIRTKLVSAYETSVDKTKLNDEITELKQQLRSVGESATFNGVNWIVLRDGADPTDPHEVPGSLIRGSNGTVSIGMLSYAGVSSTSGPITSVDARYLIDDQSSGAGGYGVLTSTAFATEAGAAKNYVLIGSQNGNMSGQVEIALDANTSRGAIVDMVNTVTGMLNQLKTIGSAFGSLESRISLQTEFAKNLSDSLTSGVGKLVDTDMEQQSSKVLALQAQQQLGLQSLAIANASYNTVLQLFQNH